MKTLSEKNALANLKSVKDRFEDLIQTDYERKAKSCKTCETQGACCLDAHFVNVHITRLEAVAIRGVLEKLPPERQLAVKKRISEAIEKYGLDSSLDSFSKTYACPLFEKEIGCLVHGKAKPAACIQHACYKDQADLPPDELQKNVESRVEMLNGRTYGNAWNWHSIPVWLAKVFLQK